MTVIEKIKRIKNEKGVTAKELSAVSGVPIGTLNKILAGSTKSVKSETLSALCLALGEDLASLLKEEQDVYKDAINQKDYGYIRVAAVSPSFSLGDIVKCEEEIKRIFIGLNKKRVNLAVFPELAISGYTLSGYRFEKL